MMAKFGVARVFYSVSPDEWQYEKGNYDNILFKLIFELVRLMWERSDELYLTRGVQEENWDD
jgi:hypothetical protein